MSSGPSALRGTGRERRPRPDDLDPDPGPRSLVTRATATDPAEAEAVVEDFYLPNRVGLPTGTRDVAMHLAGLKVGTLTVGRLGYGRAIRLVTEEASHFHVNTPTAGRALSKSGAQEPVVSEPGSAAVFTPGEAADISWNEDCVQLCLMIPRVALESELEQLIDRSIVRPLRFEPAMDLSTPTGRSWREVLDVVARELEGAPGLSAHPLAGRHLERLLIDGLLLGQSHNYSEAILGSSRAAPRGPIAKAIDLMHERPAEPWSTSTLARAVHLSVRSLQEGFKRDVGRPPMNYLRDLRIRRVGEDLRHAVPGTTTVEVIASRWGFVHMSRFAAAYRAACGEAPSQTLARL